MNNKTLSLKQRLRLVFDDDLDTELPKWRNSVDYIIVGLIILSAAEVFLSTFDSIAEQYRHILHFIDWFTVTFFTIEISLRIWSADALDERYRGLWGRVRYCCSFYGIVDLVSVVPFYINLFLPTPYSALKILRVLRLLRLFRYMKSSRFMFVAIYSKRKELTISIAFLILLTAILSAMLYFVEHKAQPMECENGWETFVWAFAKYFGDPGKIADFPLVTPAANVIAIIVGLLGIAIFAVPTGLISSGFTEALEEEKRRKELDESRNRLRKAFRRAANITLREYLNAHPDETGNFPTPLYFVPRNAPVLKIQTRQGMGINDIIDVCKEFPEFQLKNLADDISEEEKPEDRLVVEHYPLNRSYGYCTNRGSKVTIVCPTGTTEAGISRFSYYLAKMGGFNYICKELEVDLSETDSFYNMTNEPTYDGKPASAYSSKDKEAWAVIQEKKAYREDFLNDLREMTQTEGAWVVLVTLHVKNKSTNTIDFHFSHAQKDGSQPMVNDLAAYQRFFDDFSAVMQNELTLSSAMPSPRYPVIKNNLGYRIRNGNPSANVFVLRPSSELLNFLSCDMLAAYKWAQLLSKHFDNARGMADADWKDFKQKVFGYEETT